MSDDDGLWDLRVDPARLIEAPKDGTGIFVRARYENEWDAYDISELTRQSLLQWLRSRGGGNPWAENVVGILLGHGPLHDGGPTYLRLDGFSKEQQ